MSLAKCPGFLTLESISSIGFFVTCGNPESTQPLRRMYFCYAVLSSVVECCRMHATSKHTCDRVFVYAVNYKKIQVSVCFEGVI